MPSRRSLPVLVASLGLVVQGAILSLFRDEAFFRRHIEVLSAAGVKGQDLRAYETILEGAAGYMAQKDPVRDASYEEIMHFVQAYGIELAHPSLSEKLFDAFVEEIMGKHWYYMAEIVDGINYARDGQNILINVEKLQFRDRSVGTDGL